jgi:hypothetical protein
MPIIFMVATIALTGSCSMGTTGGGFRHWWRRLYGTDENLNKTDLVRLAGRFSRRVKTYAEKHEMPLLYCKPEERKQELAEAHIPQDPAFVGLFLVIINRAFGLVWDVRHTDDGRIRRLTKHYRYIIVVTK